MFEALKDYLKSAIGKVHHADVEYYKMHCNMLDQTEAELNRLRAEVKKYEKLKGITNDAPVACRRYTKVYPYARYYTDIAEKEVIKWSCPVCELFGNRHQVHEWEDNCSQCGVSLEWGKEEEAKSNENRR